MIQILGLRGKGKACRTYFYDQQHFAPSVEELFLNLDAYLNKFPEEERFNLHFTLASYDCSAAKARQGFEFQNILGIDLDELGESPDRKAVIYTVLDALGLDKNKTGVSWSGHGLHFFIKLDQGILNPLYFKTHEVFYTAMCEKINKALKQKDLLGTCDSQMFQVSRMMRLPNTLNQKEDKPAVKAELLHNRIEPQGFDLIKASGISIPERGQAINPQAMKSLKRDIDTNAVLTGCAFLKEYKENQAHASEPEWQAAVSILAFLPNGNKLVHAYSNKHPKYDYEETNRKYTHARKATGPRTCININTIYKKCASCPYFNKIQDAQCPVFITGENFVATKSTGFRTLNPDGKPGRPCFPDLYKYMQRKEKFIMQEKNTWLYTGTYWVVTQGDQDTFANNFARKHLANYTEGDVRNFWAYTKDQVGDMVDGEFFYKNNEGKVNLQNGVLDLSTGKLLKHDRDFGFRGILPYAYDADALCPRFDKFMDEITVQRFDVQTLLLEFGGYALSNDEYHLHKALFLYGDGSNGKSTFLDLLSSLVGEDNFSSVNLISMNSDRSRAELVGKSFNVSEETNPKALVKSEYFKTLSGGGTFEYRYLYKDIQRARNKAKLLIACNALPYSYDPSDGLFRRLVPVPFDAKFLKTYDIHILSKLKEERAGILNKMLAAYALAKARARFIEPESVLALQKEYREDTDSLLVWFQDRVIEGTVEKETDVNLLFSDYKSWCKMRDLPIMFQRIHSFTRAVRRRYPAVKTLRRSITLFDKTKKITNLTGVTLVEADF